MEPRVFDMAHAGSENRSTLRLPFHGTSSLTWARREWRVFLLKPGINFAKLLRPRTFSESPVVAIIGFNQLA
jgi:hypothetical protein